MKGLLIKDFLTIFKQLKLFVVMILLFTFMPGYNMAMFAIVYAAMLSITSIAYDEQSKWASLAVMMPYNTRDLVLSKYVLGYISVAAAGIITIIIQTIVRNFIEISESETTGTIGIMCVTVAMATIIQGLILPLIFKMGVEKGRLSFLIAIAVGTIVVISIGTGMMEAVEGAESGGFLIGAVVIAITVVVNVISIRISMGIYKRKEF